MNPDAPDFGLALRALAGNGVEFIVVGGVAAVLQGAPIVTMDIDIVHRRSADNVQRLLSVLVSLDAVSRAHLPRRIVPDASHLSTPGHLLLSTKAGPLDVLGSIGHGRSFDELAPHANRMRLGPDLEVLVLDLATLIDVKQESGRPKDIAALPVLRATLEEREHR